MGGTRGRLQQWESGWQWDQKVAKQAGARSRARELESRMMREQVGRRGGQEGRILREQAEGGRGGQEVDMSEFGGKPGIVTDGRCLRL